MMLYLIARIHREAPVISLGCVRLERAFSQSEQSRP